MMLFDLTYFLSPAGGATVDVAFAADSTSTSTQTAAVAVTVAFAPASISTATFAPLLTVNVATTAASTSTAAYDGVIPVPPQIASPTSDISDGGWMGNDAGTNLSTYIDELTAVDTDYIQSSLSPASADECKLRLAAVSDPGIHTGHVVHYRYGKDTAGGDALDLTVKLYDSDGTTLIAAQTHTDIPDGWSDGSLILSTTEAATITGYASGLVLGFAAVQA